MGNDDQKAQEAVENRDQPTAPNAAPSDIKPAGPHDKAGLTDYDKTPGTGSLPDEDSREADVGSD